jgi:GT2 family glycosyltransferase
MPPDLFVVIVTRDRDELLTRTLRSVGECRIPSGLRATLVIENGLRRAADRVVADASPALRARHLFEPSGNKCRALNVSLDHVGDGLVVFLDDDVRVLPDLLERYATAAEQGGAGCFFGGPVTPDYEEHPPGWLLPFLPSSAKGWRLEHPSELIARPRFLGFNWAAFAEDLRRVGGFNEDVGPGSWTSSVGDESDMQRRLMAAGLVARYIPDALVYHWVPKPQCSPAFALQRAYRDGIRVGFLAEEKWGLSICGYPMGLVKRMCEAWVAARYQRFRSDERRSFAAAITHQHRLGALKGITLKRQRASV